MPKEEALHVGYGHWSPLGGPWPPGSSLFVMSPDDEAKPRSAAVIPVVKQENPIDDGKQEKLIDLKEENPIDDGIGENPVNAKQENPIDVITLDDTPLRPMSLYHTPPRQSGLTPAAKRRLQLAEEEPVQPDGDGPVCMDDLKSVIKENTLVLRELLSAIQSLKVNV